jgi:hypothetical protein
MPFRRRAAAAGIPSPKKPFKIRVEEASGRQFPNIPRVGTALEMVGIAFITKAKL